jgi:hypothetical protein
VRPALVKSSRISVSVRIRLLVPLTTNNNMSNDVPYCEARSGSAISTRPFGCMASRISSKKRSGLRIVVVHKNAFEDIHIASGRNAGQEISCNDLTSSLCHLGFEHGTGAFRHTGELKQGAVERRVGAQNGRQQKSQSAAHLH